MKRAKKVGTVALLELQEYDKESTKTNNYWYVYFCSLIRVLKFLN